MNNFMVFMRKELWVNVPVAIFLGTVDCRTQTRKRLTHFQFRANCHVLFPEPALTLIGHQKKV